jgi:anti-anti-sigma factor
MPIRASNLKFAPTEHGVCIRLEGDGTMKNSPAAREVALNTLANDPAAQVVFDLNDCEYLDSTFLGCLMDVYRRFGRGTPQRYFVAASPAQRKKLLGPTHLDRLIPMIDAAPPARGQWVTCRSESLASKDLTRHVMECHQALAESDSPVRGVFQKIAQHLERELAKS